VIGRLESRLGYLMLTLGAVIALLPVLGVLLLALNKSTTATGGFPSISSLHPSNLGHVWTEAAFGPAMKASAIITLATVAISLVVSIPAGYAFATMSFRGRGLLFYLLLLGLLVPLEAVVIPLYFDLRHFGLVDNYWGVVLPDSALSVAFGSFWMRAFFLSTPRSLVEAARLDGVGAFETLVRVLLPLARPHILTMAVLVFVWTWNDFLLPLVMLSGSTIQTAPISLVFFQSQHTTDIVGLAGAAVLTAAPVIAVYVLLQRNFTRGMLAGAVKG